MRVKAMQEYSGDGVAARTDSSLDCRIPGQSFKKRIVLLGVQGTATVTTFTRGPKGCNLCPIITMKDRNEQREWYEQQHLE